MLSQASHWTIESNLESARQSLVPIAGTGYPRKAPSLAHQPSTGSLGSLGRSDHAGLPHMRLQLPAIRSTQGRVSYTHLASPSVLRTVPSEPHGRSTLNYFSPIERIRQLIQSLLALRPKYSTGQHLVRHKHYLHLSSSTVVKPGRMHPICRRPCGHEDCIQHCAQTFEQYSL